MEGKRRIKGKKEKKRDGNKTVYDFKLPCNLTK